MPRTYADPGGCARPASDPGGDLLARAFGARHLRAAEPASGACGEGPKWTISVRRARAASARAGVPRGRLPRLGPGRPPAPPPARPRGWGAPRALVVPQW